MPLMAHLAANSGKKSNAWQAKKSHNPLYLLLSCVVVCWISQAEKSPCRQFGSASGHHYFNELAAIRRRPYLSLCESAALAQAFRHAPQDTRWSGARTDVPSSRTPGP
jgi:hypothetical protein